MKPTIAVSAMHRGENPQPGPAVVRSLRRERNATIIGLSYDPLDSGVYTPAGDHVDAAYLMPYPNKGPRALLDRLLEIHAACGLNIVIPNQDFEIQNYLDIAGDLAARGISTFLPSQRALDRRDKEHLYKLCKSLGVKSPKTILANNAVDAVDAAREIGFPVMLKGRMYGAAQCNTAADVPVVFEQMRAIWGGHVLVQALIESDDEYSVIGLGDGHGRVVGSCAIRKTILTSSGKTFSGIVIRNPEMTTAVEKIVAALKWRGPFEIEFMGGSAGMSVVEMNPRFPSWVDFPSQIGCNLPVALVDMLTKDLRVFLPACAPGKMFVRHSIDIVGDVTQLAHLIHHGDIQCTPRP